MHIVLCTLSLLLNSPIFTTTEDLFYSAYYKKCPNGNIYICLSLKYLLVLLCLPTIQYSFPFFVLLPTDRSGGYLVNLVSKQFLMQALENLFKRKISVLGI